MGREHLHRFVIHGTEYGISYVGGPGFRDDARKIILGELGLRLGERFTNEYNYFTVWTCDLNPAECCNIRRQMRIEEEGPSAPTQQIYAVV